MSHHKNNSGKKSQIICTALLVACLFFAYPQKSEAALWPGIDPEITRVLDTVYDMIQGMIMGALKQGGVKMINSQVDGMMSGQGMSGGAAFITDWKDYLIDQPKDDAKLYMNSYLSKMTSGAGSSVMGYVAEGFSQEGGSYAHTLTQAVKDNLEFGDAPIAFSYEGDPAAMFDGKDFKMLELYTSGVNNPWSFEMEAEYAYDKKLAEEEAVTQARAVAYQGFTGTESGGDGTVTFPGILTKEIAANVEDLPNKVIAAAKSIPEVITSIVSQMITKKIQQGFSGVQKKAQSKSSTQYKFSTSTNKAMDTLGPGARFNPLGQ